MKNKTVLNVLIMAALALIMGSMLMFSSSTANAQYYGYRQYNNSYSRWWYGEYRYVSPRVFGPFIGYYNGFYYTPYPYTYYYHNRVNCNLGLQIGQVCVGISQPSY